MMKAIRHILFSLLAVLALSGLSAGDGPRAKPDKKLQGDPKVLLGDSATRQAQLKRAFEAFRTRLAVLAGRLENGSPDDKQRAASLRKAMKAIGDMGTTGRFDSLISGLTRKGADQNLDVLGRLVKDNKELRQDL